MMRFNPWRSFQTDNMIFPRRPRRRPVGYFRGACCKFSSNRALDAPGECNFFYGVGSYKVPGPCGWLLKPPQGRDVSKYVSKHAREPPGGGGILMTAQGVAK